MAPTRGIDGSQSATRATGGKGPDDLSGYKSDKYDELIREMAKKYGVPARLIKAVMQQESGFNPNAASQAQPPAVGLMQLMPGTAAHLGVTNRSDPRQSIEGGTKYLAQMLDAQGGDVKLALAAYNAGPGNVQKYGGIPPFAETQKYVKNVMGTYNGDTSVDGVNSAAAKAGGGRSSDASTPDYSASSGRDYGVPAFSLFDNMSLADLRGMADLIAGGSLAALLAMKPKEIKQKLQEKTKSGDTQKAVESGKISPGAVNSVVPDSYSAAPSGPMTIPDSGTGSPPAVEGSPTVPLPTASAEAGIPISGR